MARLSPKKQELLKQFGIQSNHNVTYYEKYVIIENFIKFCNVSDWKKYYLLLKHARAPRPFDNFVEMEFNRNFENIFENHQRK